MIKLPFQMVLPRDVVAVKGQDAMTFLSGQLSQDIEAIAVGGSSWSFLLQPQGKVDAWLRVQRIGEEDFTLDLDPGFGGAVVERLQRFLLRTKASVESAGEWTMRAVRGAVVAGGLDPQWPGIEGADLLAPKEPPAIADVPVGASGDYEELRIRCGVPAMGSELVATTIPAESGVVDRSVSFTKGCYTGQELVARIDSRGGNVPRRLRGLVVDGAAVGDAVVVAGRDVGKVTSAVEGVALAYVGRAVEPPADALVGGKVARIEALPLLP